MMLLMMLIPCGKTVVEGTEGARGFEPVTADELVACLSLIVTVVILQVIDAPGGKRLCIDRLMT